MPESDPPALLLPDVRVPAKWTLGGLVLGLVLGLLVARRGGAPGIVAAADWLGGLWLRGLQMTIVPLVVALLVMGIVRTVAAASAGRMAAYSVGQFFSVLSAGTVFAAFAMPALLRVFPVPASAAAALSGGATAGGVMAGPAPQVPGLLDFLTALVPTNVIAAASQSAILPLIVFFALFALAITRLPAPPRLQLAALFDAIASAMMVMIGWVLKLAPIGVFALAVAVAAKSGTAAIAALAHYIALVASIGLVVMVGGYVLARVGGGIPVGKFARAMLPAQAVALSTQSSLASVPAMLGSCNALGLRQTSGEFVLPLAVAVFRATSPAMNLAVAIYVGHLAGVAMTPPVIAAGVVVALLTTLGAPSLPGAISFLSSIGPIALAMGVPLGPLALLVAVEVLPDIVRTVANVTLDVAVTATVDRRAANRSDPT